MSYAERMASARVILLPQPAHSFAFQAFLSLFQVISSVQVVEFAALYHQLLISAAAGFVAASIKFSYHGFIVARNISPKLLTFVLKNTG
jgi:hypothetical protein